MDRRTAGFVPSPFSKPVTAGGVTRRLRNINEILVGLTYANCGVPVERGWFSEMVNKGAAEYGIVLAESQESCLAVAAMLGSIWDDPEWRFVTVPIELIGCPPKALYDYAVAIAAELGDPMVRNEGILNLAHIGEMINLSTVGN